jgi:hypothetical protein
VSPKLKAAVERALRTFVQASFGAMLVLLAKDGASWADVPAAGIAGAFAGFLALLALYAYPPKQG